MPSYGRLTGRVSPPDAARHDNPRGQAFPVQSQRVVQPGAEHGRRPSIVLRGAQYHDCVDRPALILLAYYQDRDEGRRIDGCRNEEEDAEDSAKA
jgi:hypothetical protein